MCAPIKCTAVCGGEENPKHKGKNVNFYKAEFGNKLPSIILLLEKSEKQILANF